MIANVRLTLSRRPQSLPGRSIRLARDLPSRSSMAEGTGGPLHWPNSTTLTMWGWDRWVVTLASTLEPLHDLVDVGEFGMKQLQRDGAACGELLGAKHQTHAPLADDSQDPVAVTECAANEGRFNHGESLCGSRARDAASRGHRCYQN